MAKLRANLGRGSVAMAIAGQFVSYALSQCHYDVTIIEGPTHPTWGAPATNGTGLNTLGEVVGAYSYLGDDDHSFVWSASEGFRTLPMPPDGLSSFAADINNSGVIVGTVETIAGYRGFVYENGAYAILPPLPGGTWSMATAINNRGQVVGLRSIGNGVSPYNAFVWENGVFTDLGVMSGPNSCATDINDNGEIVGWCGTAAYTVNTRAFFWTGGSPILLGPIPGGVQSYAIGINDAGIVIGSGYVTFGGVLLPFTWGAGEISLLTLPMGFNAGGTADLNDGGLVVGAATQLGIPDGMTHGFLWLRGYSVDLNALTYNGSAVELEAGRATNSRGQILANGQTLDAAIAALLDPAPRLSADFDADGYVGLGDLAFLLASFATDPGGDTDGDGDTDIDDLSLLLSQFGLRCP